MKKVLPLFIINITFLVLYLLLISAMGMVGALFLGVGHLSHEEMRSYYHIFNDLMVFYQPPLSVPTMLMVGTFLFSLFAWLLSTRIKATNKTVLRRILVFVFVWGTASLMICVYAAGYLKPIGYDAVLKLDGLVTREDYRSALRVGNLRLVGSFIMIVPTLLCVSVWMKLYREYKSDELVQEWFRTYQFKHRFLRRFGDVTAGESPDITLATDFDTRTPVIMTGDSRQLGTGMIGPPGSGKTSMKIIVGMRQDLGHLQRAINAFPKLSEKYGIGTEKFQRAWAKHLTGIICIEPAKDLCDQAYELAKEHGFPEELIVYLDPSNPDTPGFNAFIGPTEQVAEMISLVLDGISETTDEFFRQSCRVVLKQYIYLLKILKKNNCDILDLDAMYQDPRYVADMVEELEALLPSPEQIAQLPQDKRIYWNLAARTVRWFWNDGLMIMKDRQTGVIQKYPDGPHKGKQVVQDKQFEFTRQTRNLLSDIIMNPYLARVLTKPNAVNLDKLMSHGGILLCNTANGELGQTMSDAFGKLVLISVQNAVFRRKGSEKTRSLVSAWIDEFYDYMNPPFLKLTSQGRKYKFAVFVACQTLAQFEVKYGKAFAQSMLGTIRNWVVYGGVGSADGELLSKEFGMTVVEELVMRENITPETMNAPGRSYSEQMQRKEVENVTADNIMFNEFRFSYIKMVVEKSTQRAIKAEGNFVDTGKADKWRKALKPQALEVFMDYWSSFANSSPQQFDMDWIDEAQAIKDGITQIEEDEKHLQLLHNEESPAETKHESPVVRKEVEYIGGPQFREVPKVEQPERFLPTGSQQSETAASVTEVESPPALPVVPEEARPQEEVVPQVEQPAPGISAASLLFNVRPSSETVQPTAEAEAGHSKSETAQEVALQSEVVESRVGAGESESVPEVTPEPVVVQPAPQEPVVVQTEREKVAPSSPKGQSSASGSPQNTAEGKASEITQRRKTRKIDMLKPADSIDENNPLFQKFFAGDSKTKGPTRKNKL